MLILFFFNDTATTEIYTLSLHDALPILLCGRRGGRRVEDDGRGRLLGGRLQGPADGLDRRHRARAVEPEPRVGRHGRGEPAQRPRGRARRGPLVRCRQDAGGPWAWRRGAALP